ncbi:hypothetical protein H4R19_000441 [Coemansia spiralis]|nr:hypothetical protein H4R19_000441 [Coemansia spiralis]
MSRRRYRRIEWTDAMASHTTLVDAATGASPTPDASARTTATSRPAEIRRGARPTTSHEAQHGQGPADGSAQPHNSPVSRSNSEQTTVGSARPSTAMSKLRGGLMRRFKDSMRRQLRGFGASLVQTHYSASAHEGDVFYAVALP